MPCAGRRCWKGKAPSRAKSSGSGLQAILHPGPMLAGRMKPRLFIFAADSSLKNASTSAQFWRLSQGIEHPSFALQEQEALGSLRGLEDEE